MATQVNNPLPSNVLSRWARLPDALTNGSVVRDINEAVLSADVVWPDGEVGSFITDEVSEDFPGAIDAYHITYGNPVTRTFTQPLVTRDDGGTVINLPDIVVT